MYQTLLTSLENGVYIITINRPDKLNALNKDVFTDLNNAVTEIESNAAIKSAIKLTRTVWASPRAILAAYAFVVINQHNAIFFAFIAGSRWADWHARRFFTM